MVSRSIRSLAIALLWILAPGPVRADWPSGGVALCQAGACSANGRAVLCPDTFGGAYVVWQDYRSGNADLYAQRVLASGAIAPGWPANGLPVCTQPAFQGHSDWSLTPDGLGGMIVTWQDYRNVIPGGTSVDIYAQRVLPDGTLAPGWPLDGAPVARPPGIQRGPAALADGAGGAYFCWDEITSPRDVYLQRLTADGLPSPGWPPDGIATCAASGDQIIPRLAPGLSGGVFVAWEDYRDGPLAVYAQRVLPDGSLAPGWPVNGTRIVAGRGMRELVSDGAGGAYLACLVPGPQADAEYYLQRFSGEGTTSPGWPEGGALVCAAPGPRGGLRMTPDGAGGAHLAWNDFRGTSEEIYALRMQADGTRAPGWPADGLRVTDIQAGDYAPMPASDALGGVYLAWDRNAGGVEEIVLHHLDGMGTVAAGWPVNGLVVPGSMGSAYPAITADGFGGAIAVWDRPDGTVRALRIGADGPVAVALSLVRAEAEPGVVRLVWQAAGAAALHATVERRSEAGEWERLADIMADGTGRLAYEDRDVAPGARYAYRLAYREDGADHHTPETWVTVPRLELSLRGFTPNPSAGSPTVVFVLAEPTAALLEVYDVAGRQVARRAVGSLGAGRHELRLDPGAQLPTGVYAIRLTQAGRVLTTRGVVTR